MPNPRLLGESLDSIDRVGGKLSYADFKDYLRSVADTFPSGTEEYDFLADLLTDAKTDVVFVKKLFGLLGEKPQITDDSSYGFSWELMEPSDVGRSIYRKLEEIDKTSANDLYSFMSYVFMNYTSGVMDDMSGEPEAEESEPEAKKAEEPAPEPEFKGPDVVDATSPPALSEKPKEKVKAADEIPQPGVIKGTVTEAASYEAFSEEFPGALGMSPEIFQSFADKSPIYILNAPDGRKFAFHADVGFVDSNDDTVDTELVRQAVGEDLGDFAPLFQTDAAKAPEGSKDEVDEYSEEVAKTGNDPDHIGAAVEPVKSYIERSPREAATEAKVEKIAKNVKVGAVVKAIRDGTSLSKGQVISLKINYGDLTESTAIIRWTDGSRSEIPMRDIETLLLSTLNKSGATMALVSSSKEVNGTVTFILTGFKPSAGNAYVQTFCGKVELPKDKVTASKVSLRTRLYSGKSLASLFSGLSAAGPEVQLIAQKAFRFGKTFVSQRAAVIVKSGPYGMFAVKAPVVFVQSAKHYMLFKKIGSSYVSASGHRFRAIQAAKYGKPEYLMVAESAKEFYREKGRITCNAMHLLEKTQFILQRKAVRSAIVRQQKLNAIMASKKAKAEEQIASALEAQKKAEAVVSNQGKIIDTLNARLVSARDEGFKTPVDKDADAKRQAITQNRSSRLAQMMGQI